EGHQTSEPLMSCAEALAIQMFQSRLPAIPDQEVNQAMKKFLMKVLKAKYSNPLIQTLRTTCPLKAAGEKYQFIHKSFQAFLVAQALVKALPIRARYVYDPAQAKELHERLSKLENNLW